MRSVLTAVLALEGGPSINTAGLMDALTKTNQAWRKLGNPSDQPAFDVRMVGLRMRPIVCHDQVVVHPHLAASESLNPDLVIVPGLDDELENAIDCNRAWVPWIARWHAAESRIATSCTGAFLAAEAGVLDGRPATTHWVAANEFRRRFPQVDLAPERLIVDTGDVISSGGATTFLTLVIYLTGRFGGHERAVLASKLMLVDGDRRSQLPYTSFAPFRNHADDLVHGVQSHIEDRLHESLSVRDLAAYAFVSERTLNRRFKIATGESVQLQLRRIRIEAARRQLETTTRPVELIAGLVGYRDPAAFRRAFTRATGLNPRSYRAKYGPGSAGSY